MAGDDALSGDAGSDNLEGGDGADVLDGGDGNDYLFGESGADTLIGGAGDDRIYGWSYFPSQSGAEGDDDVLDGGAGNDYLEGDAGSNTYLFGRGDGQDIINNLDNGHSYSDTKPIELDTLQFKAGVLSTDVSLSFESSDLIIKINGSDDQVTVLGYFDAVAPGTTLELRFADGTSWDIATVTAMVLTGATGGDESIGENWSGSDGPDSFSGTAGDDTLSGGAGADYLDGGAGADVLDGGDGDDSLAGGTGSDTLIGGAGDDLLYGVYSSDYHLVGPQRDRTDDDVFDGGAGNDYLFGGPGNDTYLFGLGDGQDTIDSWADSGTDTLQFKAGVLSTDVSLSRESTDLIVKINGSADQVTVLGYFAEWAGGLEQLRFADGTVWDVSRVNAMVSNHVPTSVNPIPDTSATPGVSFHFTLPVDAFADEDAGDTLTYSAKLANGDALPNWLTFDAHTGTFTGMPGGADSGSLGLEVVATDMAGASASSLFTLNVANGGVVEPVVTPDPITTSGDADVIAGAGNDVITSLWGKPTINAGEGNNTVTTYGGDSIIQSGGGNDVISSSWGNDTINAGDGNNTINAGGGNNTITSGSGDDTIAIDWGSSTVNAGNGNNAITATGGNCRITAGTGDDRITTSWGDDTINAGDGNNTINAGGGNNTVTSGNGADAITSDGGNDVIIAGAGNDTISTGWGSDVIDAGAGDDTVLAYGGGDTVRGGQGNDTIISEQWSDDTYLFAKGDGQDSIQDNGGQDTLVLENISADELRFTHSGNDLRIGVIGSTDSITIKDWYLGDQYPGAQHHLDRIQTSDGVTLLDSQVQSLVDAMAAFSPPAAGQTTLTVGYQTALAPVIAANWH